MKIGNRFNFKRIIKLRFYSCWLWLYLYPYIWIKKLLGLNPYSGFEWVLIYKQEQYYNQFGKYKNK